MKSFALSLSIILIASFSLQAMNTSTFKDQSKKKPAPTLACWLAWARNIQNENSPSSKIDWLAFYKELPESPLLLSKL